MKWWVSVEFLRKCIGHSVWYNGFDSYQLKGLLFSNMESTTLELLQDAEDLEKVSLLTKGGVN